MSAALRSQKLVILEGPDGSGKTTLALELAKRMGARYVHLGPLAGVGRDLSRFYLEAMLPALLGYQPVVMDRSWFSEPIYGGVHRGGEDRIGTVYARMLERVALRCDPLLVICLPPLQTCRAAFDARRDREMLRDNVALAEVFCGYGDLLRRRSELNRRRGIRTVRYDYTRGSANVLFDAATFATELDERFAHRVDMPTAGNLAAPYVLIGEGFARHKSGDPLQQYPFVSFSGAGCSAWLTAGLEDVRRDEGDLLWANADLGREALRKLIDASPRAGVYALGVAAHEALDGLDGVTVLNHPQHAKRFAFTQPYALFTQLANKEYKS